MTADELAAEITKIFGVSVPVTWISEGTFEVVGVGEVLADQLVEQLRRCVGKVDESEQCGILSRITSVDIKQDLSVGVAHGGAFVAVVVSMLL